MAAVAGNVELILVTDPSTLAYLISGAAWFSENTVEDGANFAAEVVAVAAAVASLAIAQGYVSLARDYHKLYNNQRLYYYADFQNNIAGELGLLQQVFGSPLAGNGQNNTFFYDPQYQQQAAVVEDFSNNAGAFSGAGAPGQWWVRRSNMYNNSIFSTSNDGYGAGVLRGEPENLDIGSAISDFDTYMYRYEEHRKDVYDERTWEWQNQSLNFGVKQASAVQSGLATSFKFIDEATTNVADWFATQANGLSKMAGYKSASASYGAKLSASSQYGKGLAVSTNLGSDVKRMSPPSAQTYALGANPGELSMFMDQ